jgi:hypothetical protein
VAPSSGYRPTMDAADGTTGAQGRRLRVVARLVAVLGVVVAVAASAGALGLVATSGDRDAPTASVTTGASAEGFSVWERNHDGTPVRWDACSTIELVLDTRDAPAGAREDLDDAVATLREASGLDLVVSGATDERPSGSRLPYQPEDHGERWAPILVAWASPGVDGLPLRDTDRGVAIPLAVGRPGARTYVSGQVVLNADRHDLRPGSADRSDSWGATMLHELIHVLGLGHVDDPDELMYVYPGEGPVRLGPGDRAGLRAVGAEGGCLEVPTPRVVEVAGLPTR